MLVIVLVSNCAISYTSKNAILEYFRTIKPTLFTSQKLFLPFLHEIIIYKFYYLSSHR